MGRAASASNLVAQLLGIVIVAYHDCADGYGDRKVMAFDTDLKRALEKHIPAKQLHFHSTWKQQWYRSSWKGPGGRPVALILHHTAGAAGSSSNPALPAISMALTMAK